MFRISGSGKTNSETVIYCYLAYVGPFWFVGLLSGSRNRALRFHVNQGLVLFITEIASIIVARCLSGLLSLIPLPVFGVWLPRLIWTAVLGLSLWLAVTGMMNVADGQKKPLPLIGGVKLLK